MEKSNNSTYKQSGKNKIPWRLFLLLLVAFLLRIWGISFGLPSIDHGDEAEVVNHAVRFGSGDLNPHRFQYGSLFQYLLFAFYGAYFLIGYLFGKFFSVHQFAVYFINDPTVFYLIARALSAVFGTATLIIVYLIGKRIKGEEVGLIAALFLAFSYQHVVHSHYATVDATLTFFFALAVYQGVILFDKNDLWRYLVAGFSVGLAISIKFNGVIAAGTFIIAHFLSGRDRTVLHKLLCNKLWLGIASIFVGNFVASPYFYINLDVVLTEIVQLREFHAFSAFNLWVYLKEIIKVYWGVPLGALCVLGLIRSVITTNSKLLILFITASFVLCFASLHKYVEAKYILYSFPLFAVMGSHLFVECFARLKKRYLFLITFIVLVNPLYLIVNWDYEHAKKSINLEAREWVEEHIPVNSKILLDNVGNAGPKIENSFENIKRQYQRALKHNLLKAEYLKLKLESSTEPCYNIIQIDCSGGFREDDYIRYRLWQDTEEIGHSLEYYREKEFEYIIITDRYFSAMRDEFKLVKEFRQGEKGIRIYKIDL